MKNKRLVVPFRRKREGKTNYKKRIAYLTSDVPRLVIRRSLKNITAQIIQYEPQGDRVLAAATSEHIKKLGWKYSGNSIPACYLVGFLAGKKSKDAKINEANLDIGLYAPVKGSRLFAALKGALDAGLKVNHDVSVLPNPDRLKGKHIVAHRKLNEQDFMKNFESVLVKIKGGA